MNTTDIARDIVLHQDPARLDLSMGSLLLSALLEGADLPGLSPADSLNIRAAAIDAVFSYPEVGPVVEAISQGLKLEIAGVLTSAESEAVKHARIEKAIQGAFGA